MARSRARARVWVLQMRQGLRLQLALVLVLGSIRAKARTVYRETRLTFKWPLLTPNEIIIAQARAQSTSSATLTC